MHEGSKPNLAEDDDGQVLESAASISKATTKDKKLDCFIADVEDNRSFVALPDKIDMLFCLMQEILLLCLGS